MREYMLVMTGAATAWKGLGPEENQQLMDKYHAFVDMLRKGKGFVRGSALNQAGFELRTGKSGVIVDGPFPETKEVLNGYMIFKAESFTEALDLARNCPALAHGESVQVFELTEH